DQADDPFHRSRPRSNPQHVLAIENEVVHVSSHESANEPVHKFKNLQDDYSPLAETHGECSKNVQKLVIARQDLEHNVTLYTNLSNCFKDLKEEHSGYDEKVKALEKEKDELFVLNRNQNNQIQELETEMARKNSELGIAEKESTEWVKESQPCDGFHYSCTCQQCGVILLNGMCINCTYGDGKPVTCCKCESPLRSGFCLFCALNSENSFSNNPNPNSFNDSQNLSDYSPQPQYETYPCELSGNDSHYGYDCPPRFPLVYEQKPCYNQNFNENYYPHNSPSFLCCDNGESSHESFQYKSMNQKFFEPNPCYEPNSSSFDQYQPQQSSVTQQLPQRSNENIRLEMAKLIKNNRIFFNNNVFPHEEASMEILLANERILKLIQTWDDRQIESWSLPALLPQLLNNSQTIDEMLKHREKAANLAVQQEQEEHAAQTWERLSKIKHAFIYKRYQPEEIKEFMCKLLEDVRNIREELAEYISSPSWNRPTFFYDNDEEDYILYKEYLENSSNAITTVLPIKEPEYSLSMGYEHLSTTPETKSDEVIKSSVEKLVPIPSKYESNNDDISSEDDAFEDIEYVEASPLDSELVSLEEENKLLSINRLVADIESLNDNPTSDCVLKPSASFPIFEESDISISDNSLPEFETFSDHTEEMRSERLTSIVKNDIFYDSTNDPLLEEVDLFLASDNSIPLGIENIDHDSEGDIHFLKELLVDDSIPLSENESSNFNHHDDPSFPRPPPEPPDIGFFFDLEPNSGEVILAVMNNIHELNEDECFDPGGEINVFANIEDDGYFPFIFVIRIFLPYLIYLEVSPLLLS
nr:hypothetical protein [Tanacetum cinerariifolium]